LAGARRERRIERAPTFAHSAAAARQQPNEAEYEQIMGNDGRLVFRP
jgi:hypothetical protein